MITFELQSVIGFFLLFILFNSFLFTAKLTIHYIFLISIYSSAELKKRLRTVFILIIFQITYFLND